MSIAMRFFVTLLVKITGAAASEIRRAMDGVDVTEDLTSSVFIF